MTGNLCGHHPLTPRFFHGKGNRPDTLKLAQENAAKYYANPDKYLMNLQTLNGKTAQQRSERREAIATVMQVLLQYTDLLTLQVGTLVAGGDMVAMQATFLAQKTGWGLKRCYRAIKDAARAGYISIQYQRYKRFGKILSTRFIKIFPKCFHHLGISNARLETSRHYKRNSVITKGGHEGKDYQTKVERQACQANQARLSNMLLKAVGKAPAPKKEIGVDAKTPPPTPPPRSKKGLPRLSEMVKKINSTTTREEREHHANQRREYFYQLRNAGMEFDAAKAKADEKFPPLV